METDFIVIFDLDGLILDTEIIARKAWTLASDDVGYEVGPDLVARMTGRNMRDIYDILHAAVPEVAVATRLLEQANLHYHRLMDETEPPLKFGVYELFDFLESREVPKGLATSSNADQLEHKLRGKEILPRLSHTICGDQIKRGKPDPEIFLELAARFPHPPARCFVFEDSGPGIEAAHRAGMRPLLVPDFGDPAPETIARAEAVFEDLTQSIEYLQAVIQPKSPPGRGA